MRTVVGTSALRLLGLVPLLMFCASVYAAQSSLATVTVVTSGTPSTFGQTVTFTATVTGGSGTPTGTIQFKIDNVNSGNPVTMTNGSASLAISTLTVANSPHTVLANYSGDTTYFSDIGTLAGNQTVNKASTTTSVSSSQNPSVTGHSVTFTATVSANAPGGGIPNGSVQFKDNVANLGGVIVLINESAQFTTTSLSAATHPITAVYTPADTNYSASTSSPAVNQVVNSGFTITSSNTWSGLNAIGGPPNANDTVAVNAAAAPVVLTVDVNNAMCSSLSLNGASTVNTATLAFNASASLAVSTTLSLNGGSANVDVLDMTAGGMLSLSILSDSAVGNTFIPGAGAVQIGAGGALPSSAGFKTFNNLIIAPASGSVTLQQNTTVTGLLTIQGGSLACAAFNLTAGAITGSGGVNRTTGSLTFNGNQIAAYSGLITGSGTVTYSGTGIQIFTAANKYTGNTNVSNGTLIINGDQSGGTQVTVTGGVLGGTGKVDFITMNGGTLNPGDFGATGILDADVSFSQAANFTVRLNGKTAGTTYDQLKSDYVAGVVDLGTNITTLNATIGGPSTTNDTFTIISMTGTSGKVMGTFKNLPDGSTLNIGGDPFSIAYSPTAVTLKRLGAAVRKTGIYVVAAASGSSEVKVYDAATGTLKFDFFAFAANFQGGVTVAVGDVNGDGVPDIICGAGPGGNSVVKVFSGFDASLLTQFTAFKGFNGGVTVAAGDIDGDGKADIIVGAGAGGSPQVKVYSGAALGGTPIADFFAFSPSFTGVFVAAGDVNGDGKADLIVGAGAGGGPQVVVIDGTKLTQVQPNGQLSNSALLGSFFAFAPGFAGGVRVAAGDVNGDGLADVIVGTGPGAAQVKEISGKSLNSVNPDGSISDSALLQNFFTSGSKAGITVGAVDVNADGLDDILAGAGPGDPGQLRIFSGSSSALLQNFFAFDSNFLGGINVAGGYGVKPAPLLASRATATPNPAPVAQTVQFSVTATGALRYAWDFGDGSQAIGQTPTHAYVVAGTYNASVLCFDALNQSASSSVSVTVVPLTAGIGVLPGEIDSDGDGYSDNVEMAAGTDPKDPNSEPSGLPPVAGALTQSGFKLSTTTAPAKLPSRKAQKVNKLTVTGTVQIPKDFVVTGKRVVADINGFAVAFTLGKTGKSVKTNSKDKNSFSVSVKSKKGAVAAQTSKFTLVLVGVPDTVKAGVPYQLVVGNIVYQH